MMKPEKNQANSALMPDISNMKASVPRKDELARRYCFKSENNSNQQDVQNIAHHPSKDTESKSECHQRTVNIAENTQQSENTVDNILEENVSVVVHCDTS